MIPSMVTSEKQQDIRSAEPNAFEVRADTHAGSREPSLSSTQEALAQRRVSSRPTLSSARIAPRLASSVVEVALLVAFCAAVEGWSPRCGLRINRGRGRSVRQRDPMPLLSILSSRDSPEDTTLLVN